MSSQWVQHISGQGEKWKVVEARYTGTNTWMAKNADVENDNVDLLYLPKSEYRLCEPPEQWVDVTEQVTLADSGRDLNHDRCQWRAVPIYNGDSLYRLRKVQVHILEDLPRGKNESWGWAFVIERKQP